MVPSELINRKRGRAWTLTFFLALNILDCNDFPKRINKQYVDIAAEASLDYYFK